MKIIAANSNLPLADAIAAYLNLPVTEATIRRFSDMECFVEIHDDISSHLAFEQIQEYSIIVSKGPHHMKSKGQFGFLL